MGDEFQVVALKKKKLVSFFGFYGFAHKNQSSKNKKQKRKKRKKKTNPTKPITKTTKPIDKQKTKVHQHYLYPPKSKRKKKKKKEKKRKKKKKMPGHQPTERGWNASPFIIFFSFFSFLVFSFFLFFFVLLFSILLLVGGLHLFQKGVVFSSLKRGRKREKHTEDQRKIRTKKSKTLKNPTNLTY